MSKMSNCQDAEKRLEMMRVFMDDEATHQEAALLLSHLDHCQQCLDLYYLELETKSALKKRIHRIPVPTGLLNTVKFQLS